MYNRDITWKLQVTSLLIHMRAFMALTEIEVNLSFTVEDMQFFAAFILQF